MKQLESMVPLVMLAILLASALPAYCSPRPCDLQISSSANMITPCVGDTVQFFVQVENLGDLQCINVVVILQLDWPGLPSLTEQSQLGSFMAVSGKPLTATNETAAYTLKGVLTGGQVAAIAFTGTVTDYSVGSTVVMTTAATSDEGSVGGDFSNFMVPMECSCDIVYDYSFDAPPCIGRRLAMTLNFKNEGNAACKSLDLEIEIPGLRSLDFRLFGAAIESSTDAYIDQSEETAGPNGIQRQGVIRILATNLHLSSGESGGAVFSGVPSQLHEGDSPIALVTALSAYASDGTIYSGGVQTFVFATQAICPATPKPPKPPHPPPPPNHSPWPAYPTTPSNAPTLGGHNNNVGYYSKPVEGQPPVWLRCVAPGSSQQLMLHRGGMCYKSSGAGNHCVVAKVHAQVSGGQFNCIKSSETEHSILLLNNHRATAEHVSFASVAIGSINLKGLGGVQGVHLKLYDSQQVLQVRLKDTYGALKRFKGKKLVLMGHSKDPATQLPVCFSAVVKVCDSRFSRS